MGIHAWRVGSCSRVAAGTSEPALQGSKSLGLWRGPHPCEARNCRRPAAAGLCQPPRRGLPACTRSRGREDEIRGNGTEPLRPSPPAPRFSTATVSKVCCARDPLLRVCKSVPTRASRSSPRSVSAPPPTTTCITVGDESSPLAGVATTTILHYVYYSTFPILVSTPK